MSDDRVQEALAAHLEALETGGVADTSHLTDDERAQLAELVALLDQTQDMPFGRGLEPSSRATATTDAGARLLDALRDALPPSVRITNDAAATTASIDGLAEGFVVGTFGGRVRVWLVDRDALEMSDAWLRSLERAFRLFPDTAAIALVDRSLGALLVQPEDCAPAIEAPRGMIVARRYRRPVHPVGDAVAAFLRELIPYWDPVPGIEQDALPPVDLAPIAAERAATAIAEQQAAGARARKTNPKRVALVGLGDEESRAIEALVLGVHEGAVGADDVEATLRRLAAER